MVLRGGASGIQPEKPDKHHPRPRSRIMAIDNSEIRLTLPTLETRSVTRWWSVHPWSRFSQGPRAPQNQDRIVDNLAERHEFVQLGGRLWVEAEQSGWGGGREEAEVKRR